MAWIRGVVVEVVECKSKRETKLRNYEITNLEFLEFLLSPIKVKITFCNHCNNVDEKSKTPSRKESALRPPVRS